MEIIRREPDRVKQGIKAKNADSALVDKFLKLDEEWRELINKIDTGRAELNKQNTGHKPDASAIEKARSVKEKIKKFESELAEIEGKRSATLGMIPNLPLPEAPVGKSEKENVVLRHVGKKPDFGFTPKDYIEISARLDLIDTERAAKVSGSRFGYLKHEAPLLEFALIQLVLNFVTNEKNIRKIIKEEKLNLLPKPFIPVIPPVLIKPEAMKAMGYTDRGSEEIYFLEKDQLYLVGTSEQSIGPMHMNESFEKKVLPHRHISFSTCFRREAGSYGKDTKGILRVHQFDKLEMFVTATPETSSNEHKLLLGIEERLMQLLGLPYRVLKIATGDLGDPAAAKYDIEAWLPGQNNGKGEFRETHSTSNTTDYQARRLNVKYKPEGNYVHMLNGTAFAIGRILIAIIENYQTKNGAVRVPKTLRKYVGLKEIKR